MAEARNYDSIVNRNEITDAAASAFANPEQIPEKYVRTEEVLDGVVVGEDERYELPVVDMARLLDPELSASEIAKLGDACRNWGFFQVRAIISSHFFRLHACLINSNHRIISSHIIRNVLRRSSLIFRCFFFCVCVWWSS
jgi:hypothetical protein